MPSWNKLEYEIAKPGSGSGSVSQPIATDANIEMEDAIASSDWQQLLEPNEERQGFLVQNTSQNEIFIRVEGSTVTGARLPSYGDSFSPDFRPEGGYEIKAASDNSTYVLTVW